MRRQEREPEVGIVQIVPPEQAADPDRNAPVLELHEAETDPVAGVHFDRPLFDVRARVLERPDAPVADETKPVRVVDELENERRVVRRQPADDEPIRFEALHRASPTLSEDP